jgi:membrane-bound lytic murein transglycosylase D
MFKVKNIFIRKIKKLFVLAMVLVLAVLTLPLIGDETETNLFETPNCLKDNVAFWKKIYTEVSLKEGLLHDNEYPLVIYQKIYVGTLSGRTRRRLVGKFIDDVKHSLKIINEKPQALWGTKEKEIFSLFVEHGDITYLKGAADRIRFQLGQKERFKEGLEHGAAYMDYIRQVFKQYGIPERIAYLPHVESSLMLELIPK